MTNNPVSRFIELTRDGFDGNNPEHISALAKIAMAASEAGCDDMNAIITKTLLDASGQTRHYRDYRRQFSHGGEAED